MANGKKFSLTDVLRNGFWEVKNFGFFYSSHVGGEGGSEARVTFVTLFFFFFFLAPGGGGGGVRGPCDICHTFFFFF